MKESRSHTFGILETYKNYTEFIDKFSKCEENIEELTFSRFDGTKIIIKNFKDILRFNKIKKLKYG